MHVTKLRAVGGSIMFAIPKAILDSLHLQANASVGLSVSEGKLIIDPQVRQRYTLAELLAQCDSAAPQSTEDIAWINDAAVGDEAI